MSDSNKTTPRITADQLRGVRNDSSLSPGQVARRLANGVEIKYGNLCMLVEPQALAAVREQVAAMEPEGRRRSMLSVDRALTKNVPKIARGGASKKKHDDTYADLMLWQALKECMNV